MKPSEMVKKVKAARELLIEVRDDHRRCPWEAIEAIKEATEALSKALILLKVKAFDEEIGEA